MTGLERLRERFKKQVSLLIVRVVLAGKMGSMVIGMEQKRQQ